MTAGSSFWDQSGTAKRILCVSAIPLIFFTNFELTYSDIHGDAVSAEYSGLRLSGVSSAISSLWVLYFGLGLIRTIVAGNILKAAGKGFSPNDWAVWCSYFPSFRLYLYTAPLFLGFRCSWFSEAANRYSTLSFGTTSSVAPVILSLAAATLLNLYIASAQMIGRHLKLARINICENSSDMDVEQPHEDRK